MYLLFFYALFSTPSNRTRGRLWVFSKCRPHLFPPFEFFVLQTKEILFSICSLRSLKKMTTEVEFQEQIFFEILEFLLGLSKTQKKWKKWKRNRKRMKSTRKKNEWWRKMNNREQNSRVSRENDFFSSFVNLETEQTMLHGQFE